ncbi:hypothetical protein GCM10022237_05760 [Nocardioides ginsengisoli]
MTTGDHDHDPISSRAPAVAVDRDPVATAPLAKQNRRTVPVMLGLGLVLLAVPVRLIWGQSLTCTPSQSGPAIR